LVSPPLQRGRLTILPLTPLDISDYARRQRLEAAAKAKRIAQRQRDRAQFYSNNGVAGSGEATQPATTGSNGPLRAGQPTPVLRAGGMVQYDAPSRSEPEEQLIPLSRDYPFKTLLLVDNNKIYLGGDRAPLRITPPLQPFTFTGQLVNSGGTSGWGMSWLDMTFSPDKIRFLLPSGERQLSIFDSVQPIGQNYWINRFPAFLVLNSARTTLNGIPPALSEFTNEIGLESGIPTTGYNFGVRYTETVSRSSPAWPPYDAGPVNVGSWDWSTVTSFNGIVRSRPGHEVTWTSYDFSQRKFGDRFYPTAVFLYDPSLVDPVAPIAGVVNNFVDSTSQTTYTRTPDFSEIDIVETLDDFVYSSTRIDIPLIGNQQRQYLQESTTEETFNATDNRTTGAGGANGTYSGTRNKTINGGMRNPLERILRGDRVCLVTETSTFKTQVIATTETRQFSSGTVTQTIRPLMQSPVFGGGGYIVSGSLVASGPLGGWFSGGSNFEGRIGEPAPPSQIWNRGTLLTSAEAFQIGGGSFDGGTTYYATTSVFGAIYDNAYSDNSTNTTVFSEYEYTKALGIENLWDAPGAEAVEYDREISKFIVSVDTTDYSVPLQHFLLTETETLAIDAEPHQIVADIPASYVSALPLGVAGSMTISHSSSTGVLIDTSRLAQKRITTTTTLTYTGGSHVPSQDTVQTDTLWTSIPITVIGTAVEVYRINAGAIERWIGTIAAFSGPGNPAIPDASGSTGTGRNFTNTFSGSYPQLITVRSLTLNIASSSAVPFCPWPLGDNGYTVVINPDHAILAQSVKSQSFIRTAPLNPQFCNIRAGTGPVIASLYVCNGTRYQAGKTNYAAIWDIRKIEDGKAAIAKRESLAKGSTRSDTEASGGSLVAVQYFG
jgi:hypothetical protein